MGNTFRFNKFFQKAFALPLVLLSLASCVPGINKDVRTRVSANASSGSTNVAVTMGRVLKDNPVILSKNPALPVGTDLNKYLGSAVFITNHSFLQANGNCYGLAYCFEVTQNLNAVSALQTKDGKWGFNANSEEFLQVNTFYHMNKLFDQFFATLEMSYNGYKSLNDSESALPLLTDIKQNGQYVLAAQTLSAYTNCDVEDNAYYDSAKEILCFGYSGSTTKLRWATDSTIIYHELGHYFQRLMVNLRNQDFINTNPNIDVKAQLGNHLYTEAGAIGEGLSDFFSYYVNGRTHWGEWAGGNLKSSRPLSEDDALHSPGISTDEDQRLSYPEYITYDPNFPAEPVEDIHITGMVISHYLVALTKDLESKCSMTNKDARDYVMYLVTETLAELGDFTAAGTNSAIDKVNMNASYSKIWFDINNPVNYRSFSQTIAKNLLTTIGNPVLARCNGGIYGQDQIEPLLDSYGLLLFKTYNQYRNLTGTEATLGSGVFRTNVAVKSVYRKKSVLVSKNNIILDPTTGASSAFVIDSPTQIKVGLDKVLSSGAGTTLSSQTDSGLGFNNGNSKVSPGEVVAIALNLYNNSNSTIGGIEVLANDWDHADKTTGAPCRMGSTTSELWPLASEGGVEGGDCGTVSEDDFAPVCFVQSNEASATKWISQRQFRKNMALETKFCLDTTTDPLVPKDKDCFMRAIKGAEKATFSKINPKKNWGKTMANPTSGAAYSLDWGNVILFEVSKHIPPGTIMDCRLRVRFTNCEDCYQDQNAARPTNSLKTNDYHDREYNGPTPFKIIHLQIPITD